MKGRRWTPEEDRVLVAHWPDRETITRLTGRRSGSLHSRAAILGLHKPYPRARRSSVLEGAPTGSAINYWPTRPRHVTDALAALAESNPTPAEYERRKRQILAERGDT